jgi:Zn finger protein HypA/HybF involved in hydrogenase expression
MMPTIKCAKCNVDILPNGKCPKCHNQGIKLSGNASIIMSDDGSINIRVGASNKED